MDGLRPGLRGGSYAGVGIDDLLPVGACPCPVGGVGYGPSGKGAPSIASEYVLAPPRLLKLPAVLVVDRPRKVVDPESKRTRCDGDRARRRDRLIPSLRRAAVRRAARLFFPRFTGAPNYCARIHRRRARATAPGLSDSPTRWELDSRDGLFLLLLLSSPQHRNARRMRRREAANLLRDGRSATTAPE